MSIEHMEPIQNPTAAKAFQLAYDDLLERDIPRLLISDFLADANDAADESILAASVKSHVEFETLIGRDDPNATIKRAITNAGYAARAVIEFDSFLRDDAHAPEPVIYAEQHRKYPDDVPDYLRVHFTVADGTKLTAHTRNGAGEPYYAVRPDVKYGVNSPLIGHGKVMQDSLQGTQAYEPTQPDQKGGFMMAIAVEYPDISSGALWPATYRLNTFTHGTDNVTALFSAMIDKDYIEGYSQHRSQRGGYLLLRQARFMGHAIADELFSIADESGIVPVWQRQVADDFALEAVATLEELQKSSKTTASYAEHYFGNIFGGKELELETLQVQPNSIIAKAKAHATQRKLQVSDSEIEQIVSLITKN